MSSNSERIQCFCVSFFGGGGVNVGNDCCCWLVGEIIFVCGGYEVINDK